VLDLLRFASAAAGGDDTLPGFSKYAASLGDELDHSGLSMSDVVRKVVGLMSPWDKPFGVLSIKATKAKYRVLLDGMEVGLTTWISRIQPGVHQVYAVRAGKTAYSNTMLKLTAGDRIEIDLDQLVKP